MILDHKLQRMFNDFKIGQLNSERPLHQTAVLFDYPPKATLMAKRVKVLDALCPLCLWQCLKYWLVAIGRGIGGDFVFGPFP